MSKLRKYYSKYSPKIETVSGIESCQKCQLNFTHSDLLHF